MNIYYSDYIWKGGIPYGIGEKGKWGYKIVMDPYRKRICIEFAKEKEIPSLIYDSALLDFRHLKQENHQGWQKEIVQETEKTVVCLIRDQNDRLLFIETHHFTSDVCRLCCVTSLHGVVLSIHKMFYTSLGDPYDGVALYDVQNRLVMCKRYVFDSGSRQFTELLEEHWDARRLDAPLREFLIALAQTNV
jgi:hypothetical protein